MEIRTEAVKEVCELMAKSHMRTLWSDENVLDFNVFAIYLGVNVCQKPLTSVPFSVCEFYLNKNVL